MIDLVKVQIEIFKVLTQIGLYCGFTNCVPRRSSDNNIGLVIYNN